MKLRYKLRIIAISMVLTLIVVYFCWNCHRIDSMVFNQGLEPTTDTQKVQSRERVENGDRGLEGLKTIDLRRIDVRLCPECKQETMVKTGLVFKCRECKAEYDWNEL